MTTYIVTAPLVQVETTARNFVQLPQGAEVPSSVTDAALANLIELGYAEKVEDPAGPPAKSAAKSEWEAYARSQGATDDDLAGVTKDELVELYGAS